VRNRIISLAAPKPAELRGGEIRAAGSIWEPFLFRASSTTANAFHS
jgi:hypothetical protein